MGYESKINSYRESHIKGFEDKFSFQTEYVKELYKDVDYKGNVISEPLLLEWLEHTRKDVCGNRNHTYVSLVTGKRSSGYDNPYQTYLEDPLLELVKEK